MSNLAEKKTVDITDSIERLTTILGDIEDISKILACTSLADRKLLYSSLVATKTRLYVLNMTAGKYDEELRISSRLLLPRLSYDARGNYVHIDFSLTEVKGADVKIYYNRGYIVTTIYPRDKRLHEILSITYPPRVFESYIALSMNTSIVELVKKFIEKYGDRLPATFRKNLEEYKLVEKQVKPMVPHKSMIKNLENIIRNQRRALIRTNISVFLDTVLKGLGYKEEIDVYVQIPHTSKEIYLNILDGTQLLWFTTDERGAKYLIKTIRGYDRVISRYKQVTEKLHRSFLIGYLVLRSVSRPR